MAATGTPTPNIGLRIPIGTDPASVDDINYNSNLLDTKLGAVGSDSVQDQIDTLNGKITTDWGNASSWCTSIESGATTNWQKFGSVRTITFRGTSRTHTEDEVLMTIPQGHRPLSNVYTIGAIGNVPVVIQIASETGNMALFLANNAGSGRIHFSVTYIALD